MTPQHHITKIIPEVCRALRGDIPQTVLNKKFNFKGNVISKWECGTRQLSWLEFVDLCKHTGHDVNQVMATHYLFEGAVDNQEQLLEHIFSAISEDFENSPISGIKPNKIKALRSGKNPLCLDEFLIIMESINEAMNFLTFLMGEEKIKTYIKSLDHYQKLLDLTHRNHFVGPLFTWIAAHQQNLISRIKINKLAEIFSIQQNELEDILREFIGIGLLKEVGDSYIFQNIGLPNNSRSEDFETLKHKCLLSKSIIDKRYLETKQRSNKNKSLFVFIPFPKGAESDLERVMLSLSVPLGKLKQKAMSEKNFDFLIFNFTYSIINLK